MVFSFRRCHLGGLRIAHQADVVVDAGGVALGTLGEVVAVRLVGQAAEVAALPVTALGSGAVDVQPGAIHVARGPSEADVDTRGTSAVEAGVGGAGPEPRVIKRTVFVGDLGDVEHRVDGRRVGRIGRSGVIDKALHLLGVGQPPVAVAEVVLGVFPLDPGQGLLPVHPCAAIVLGPHQAGGVVSDCAVSVAREVVDSVAGIAAHEVDVVQFGDRTTRAGGVSLDAAIGEVEAEGGRLVAEDAPDIGVAGPELGVDDALTGVRVAVGEGEVRRVDERRHAGGVRAAGVGAPEVHEGVELLHGRQPPVAVAAVVLGVERAGVGLRFAEGQFVVHVDVAVPVEVGALRPRQPGDVVVDSQAVPTEGVAGLVAVELGVLPVERLALGGAGDL